MLYCVMSCVMRQLNCHRVQALVLEGEEGGAAGVEELVEALEVGDVPRHQLQVLLLLRGVKSIAPGMGIKLS